MTSQETSPLLTIWMVGIFFTIIAIIMITRNHEWKILKKDLKKNAALITSTGIIDSLAWIFFASATIFIPISIANSISQSYVAGTVLLGIFLNKEKIRTYQGAGIALTLTAVMVLSVLTL